MEQMTTKEFVELIMDFADHDCYTDEQYEIRRLLNEAARKIKKINNIDTTGTDEKKVKYFACPKCGYILMEEEK